LKKDFESFVAQLPARMHQLACYPGVNFHVYFVGAVLLYSMKADFIVSLVAEYEDEFIHFYWDTTA
jgi:hypothetical protein